MQKHVELGRWMPPVCRLGLATRGNTHLPCDDVLSALERGINYWNWCGHDDGMSEALRQLGPKRGTVVLATQLPATGRTRDEMWRKLTWALNNLGTDYLDVVTLYYVESRAEWEESVSSAGAIQALQEARDQGVIRAIGLTTHQRDLAAEWVQTGLLDTLMVRYNAAHRGAEQDVFPITDKLGVPTICFTCLRWGALQKPTREDPPDFVIPSASTWYRFVLSNPSVAVALMAPNDRAELDENLLLLDDWRPVSPAQRQKLCAHGDRVRNSAGPFP
jgi:aryl-alcohol dehydrogenase-like predicted oxidoreductase